MNQQYLFKEETNIPGLTYIPNYIPIEYASELIQLIDANTWNLDLKRRTQHYGYKYDYTVRSIDPSYYLGEIPHWIGELCNKLCVESIFIEKPDQVIINEYMPGQGIAPHIDCVPCFTDTICSLSLASGCVMDLTNGDIKKSIPLEPNSLLVLQSEARYKWKHGIAPRKIDNGVRRGRRISLTFRKVIL
jgi:alkylated DNA repair dioxygenase AlkB